MNYTIASPGFRMEGLEPGQRNDFEIKSYCLMSGERKGQAIEYKLFSNAATFRARSYLYISRFLQKTTVKFSQRFQQSFGTRPFSMRTQILLYIILLYIYSFFRFLMEPIKTLVALFAGYCSNL